MLQLKLLSPLIFYFGLNFICRNRSIFNNSLRHNIYKRESVESQLTFFISVSRDSGIFLPLSQGPGAA